MVDSAFEASDCFNRSALDIEIALGPGKKVMHNQVLKNLIVGITLPEFEPVVTHVSCYWTNVCLHFSLTPELIGDKVGALEAEARISAGFMEGFPSPKAQNSHPSIFSSFFTGTYENAMFVSLSVLQSWGRRRKWWQSTSVWWIRWLTPGAAKCVGFNWSKFCMPKHGYKCKSSNLDYSRLL